ncbi:hypothetical protein BDZ89DRAFT_1056248 [Hymenopellis radicata]|nr:hypothetical protein BDZ89DRAFT_1056248 [Hymenopellis radicata]
MDAFIEIAFICPTKKDSMKFLDDGLKFGRQLMQKRLGASCFEDWHVGQFWNILDTRPYMRLLQTRVRFNFMMEDYKAAVETCMEMIRLCPGDNLDRYSDALWFAQLYLDYSLETYPEGGGLPYPEGGGLPFKNPKRDLYPTDEESWERLTFTKCSLTYTAAYASFKLLGDCEASRQYLQLATEGCRHVLIKILAKINKPAELCMSARAHNSTEDAHDYLYKAQDLWMADDVWKWVNNNREAQLATIKFCENEHCEKRESKAAEFKRCSSCHQVSYCSPECQKEDWKRHRLDCKQRAAIKAATKAVVEGQPMPKDNPMPVYTADFSGDAFIVTEGSAPSGVVVPDGPSKSKKKKSKKKKTKSKVQTSSLSCTLLCAF